MTTSLPSPVAQSAEGHYAHKLLNDLMENYSSALRPVEDTDLALNVTLQITPLSDQRHGEYVFLRLDAYHTVEAQRGK